MRLVRPITAAAILPLLANLSVPSLHGPAGPRMMIHQQQQRAAARLDETRAGLHLVIASHFSTATSKLYCTIAIAGQVNSS